MLTTQSGLSRRVLESAESLTVATFAKIGQLKREGADLISLVAGEPDFDTPDNIKEAAIRAIREGKTKYTSPASGVQELRIAISDKLLRDNNLHYDPDQIVVTCGAKQVIFDAIVSLINPGDEVVIPAPFWVSYADQARLMGGVPVIVPTEASERFRLTPKALREALTPRTKLLMLNSPCNPTGEVYTGEELGALAEVVAEAGIYVILDEIYEKILYDGAEHVSMAALCEDVKERALVTNGVSKAYAMTGWRVGYGAGPADLMDQIKKVQSQETTNTCTVSQYAALEALTGPQESVERMRTAFQARRDLIVDRLNRIPGFQCPCPEGAFYVFPDISGLLGSRLPSDFELTDYILDRARVGIVSGGGFGVSGHVRMSYATAEEEINEAMNRIEQAVNELST